MPLSHYSKFSLTPHSSKIAFKVFVDLFFSGWVEYLLDCRIFNSMMDHLVYFLLLALLAEILGTMGGFGSSLFFVPIASYFLDFQSVLGITGLFHVTSNLSKIALFRNGFDKKLVISVGLPAVLFVVVGAWLSHWIDTRYLEIALAIFLLGSSLVLLLFKKLVLPANQTNAVLGGAFSGLVAGMVGTGGAIRGITLSAFNLQTEVFIATSAIIDLGIDTSRSIVYAANGYVHRADLYLIPWLFIVSGVGTWIGKQILKKVSAEHFKTLVLVFIFITGLVTLYGVLQKG